MGNRHNKVGAILGAFETVFIYPGLFFFAPILKTDQLYSLPLKTLFPPSLINPSHFPHFSRFVPQERTGSLLLVSVAS